MNEHDSTVVWSRKNLISRRIGALVNNLTEDLTPEQDEALHQQLTDEYRFWQN